MAQKPKDTLAVRPQSRGRRSPSRSPKPKSRKPLPVPQKTYASDGVKNNDIFKLPGSDYKLVVLVTLIATAVRLFRIYQPTSVVFDEVQYVPHQYCVIHRNKNERRLMICAQTASVDLPPNTSRENSSWMCTPR